MVLLENFIPSSFILVTFNNFTILTFWNGKKNTLILQLGLLEKNNLTRETGRHTVHWEKGNRKRQKTGDNKQSPALLQYEIEFSPEWKTSHTKLNTITYGLLKGLGITFFLYAQILMLSFKTGGDYDYLICLHNNQYASIGILFLKGQNRAFPPVASFYSHGDLRTQWDISPSDTRYIPQSRLFLVWRGDIFGTKRVLLR